MTDPKTAAIGFECVKVSMSQTKDGIKIVLVIHPNDDTQDLFNHPVGSRYQAALVLVDEDNQPVPPKSKTNGERALTSAIMLAKDTNFHRWLADKVSTLPDEEVAAEFIRSYCGIGSRSELATDKAAQDKFDELRLRFSMGR